MKNPAAKKAAGLSFSKSEVGAIRPWHTTAILAAKQPY